MAMDFAARWPDRPEFTNVDVSALALMSNSYADTPGATDADDELPLRSFDTETGPRQQNPAGETAFRLALLEAALGLGRVDKLNPDSDAGKQHEGGEALDQLVVAGGDTA